MKAPVTATNPSDAQIVEIWAKVVDVQMHFNDIEMRIRNFALSVVLAVFAAYGFLLSHDSFISILSMKIYLYTVVPLMGSVAVYLFFFMDFYWYHRLLLGAVQQGVEIEKRHELNLPELSITKMIGKTSPIKPTGPLWILSYLFIRDKKFKDDGNLHSDSKIKLFYYTIISFLLFLFAISSLTGGVRVSDTNLLSWFSKFVCTN